MPDAALTYRWTRDEFLRAWEAGVFRERVEFIDGEVWPVVIGEWHGDTTMRVARLLPDASTTVSAATLPAGDSLPDPDCWVRGHGAEPTGTLTKRLSTWQAADVFLVVEVSDETELQDLTVKAELYGRSGFPVYWVVTHDVIYEHTEPNAAGYANRHEYRRGDRIPVRYAGTDLAVAELLGS